MTTRRSVLSGLAAMPIIAAAVPVPASAAVSPALLSLIERYKAAVQAVEQHSGPDGTEFDSLVDEECALARLIAMSPAETFADIAIKTAVALRETGLPSIKLAEPVDCGALMDIFDDQTRPDIAELINMSIILDVVRLSGRAVRS